MCQIFLFLFFMNVNQKITNKFTKTLSAQAVYWHVELWLEKHMHHVCDRSHVNSDRQFAEFGCVSGSPTKSVQMHAEALHNSKSADAVLDILRCCSRCIGLCNDFLEQFKCLFGLALSSHKLWNGIERITVCNHALDGCRV